MTQQKKALKVLLAQFPLESHSRGIITVAGMLRDAGHEVILLGNALPENIVNTAVQEDADVVGISTYCGGELALGQDLMKAADKAGIRERTIFVLGGIFPPKDAPELEKIGFTATFPPSSTQQEIVGCIEEAVAARRRHAC